MPRTHFDGEGQIPDGHEPVLQSLAAQWAGLGVLEQHFDQHSSFALQPPQR
jgi:hypothetical protein